MRRYGRNSLRGCTRGRGAARGAGQGRGFFQDLQSDQGFGRQGEFPDTPVFPRGGGRRYPLDAGGRGSIGAGGGRGIHLRRRDGSCLTDPRLHVQAAPAADSSEKK